MARLDRKAGGAVTNKALSDVAAEFGQQTALSLAGTTQNITFTRNQTASTTGTPMYVTIQPDLDIYFAWAGDTDDIIDTAVSLWLPGGGAPVDMRVRWGTALDGSPNTVVLQVQRKVASTTTVKYAVG